MVSRRLHADVSASCTSIVGKTLFLLEGRRATSNKSGGSGVVNALGVLNPGRELRGVIVSVGLGVFRERGESRGVGEPCELWVRAGLGVLRGLVDSVQFPRIGLTELADVRCVLLDADVVFRKVD